MKAEQAKTIDEYIAGYPDDVQQLLQTIRTTIHNAAPQAEEAIAYGIPTFKFNGNLVHFGGYKNHIGFYPAPMGIEAFKEETAQYEAGKGTLQFPVDQPMPLELIEKIVKFRVEKNLAKGKVKKQ
ncbi:MAG: hypothetical protein JWR50_546 [Mucilaginibacter sp.]|nr:hypothetical protein [Mucilaginibacter sp.]